MRNYPEELAAREEENASLKEAMSELKQRYDTDISALKKENTELKKTIAQLKSKQPKATPPKINVSIGRFDNIR